MNPFLILSLQSTAIYNSGQFRRDRNEHGSGLMLFVKQGIPVKRIKALESEDIEVICLEVNIAKRKWAIFNIYRPVKI